MSVSCGVGRIPLAVIFVSSVTEATEAATVGTSLVPLMVTVRVLEELPPWLSVTVYWKTSVRVSPTPSACTADRLLLSV